MGECEHYWVPNSGRGGEPKFLMNRTMHPTEPLMHVQCSRCGVRTWLTEAQWWAIPATNCQENMQLNSE